MFGKLKNAFNRGQASDRDNYEYVEERVSAQGSVQGEQGPVPAAVFVSGHLDAAFVRPSGYRSAREIADHINEGRLVVLNLETASSETAKRIIDFLSGAAYANNTWLTRAAQNTFVIPPAAVETVDEMEKASEETKDDLFADVISF